MTTEVGEGRSPVGWGNGPVSGVQLENNQQTARVTRRLKLRLGEERDMIGLYTRFSFPFNGVMGEQM
jgi:hypothetical protein